MTVRSLESGQLLLARSGRQSAPNLNANKCIAQDRSSRLRVRLLRRRVGWCALGDGAGRSPRQRCRPPQRCCAFGVGFTPSRMTRVRSALAMIRVRWLCFPKSLVFGGLVLPRAPYDPVVLSIWDCRVVVCSSVGAHHSLGIRCDMGRLPIKLAV